MIDFLMKMKHSPVRNYGGIPGLTSWLIGEPSNQGLVRLMECSRSHQEPIIPHSHRFNFHCTVLKGRVRNLTWVRGSGDEFEATELVYAGKPGQYEKLSGDRACWDIRGNVYAAGTTYSMAAAEVHSIFFDRGTVVLFLEGPQVSDRSIILQPVVDGEVIPTFKVEEWMFKKDK